MSKIINLYSGPGGGKTTIAAGLMYEMKKLGITVDSPYEYAKGLAWDNNMVALNDQLFVLANQHHSIVKSFGKVDYIITDSPILLSLVYKNKYTNGIYPTYLYDEYFDEMVLNMHRSYDSTNIFLENRRTTFNQTERVQNKSESEKIDSEILNILNEHDVEYKKLKVDENTVKNIMKILELTN